jgi:hypothetical protein
MERGKPELAAGAEVELIKIRVWSETTQIPVGPHSAKLQVTHPEVTGASFNLSYTAYPSVPGDAAAPVIYITGQPVSAAYEPRDTGTIGNPTLTVTATNPDAGNGGVLSYQWYSKTSPGNTGGTLIEGATSASYTPPHRNTVGERVYYYVVVTNTNPNRIGTKTASVTSNAVYIIVMKEYNVGETGPALGRIFYNRGYYGNPEGVDFWRYLEASLSDQAMDGIPWLPEGTGTHREAQLWSTLGAGKQNTASTVAYADSRGKNKVDYAAGRADLYDINGYNDWFLPSYDELLQMYNRRADIGGFDNNASYWASSTDGYTGTTAEALDFTDHSHKWADKWNISFKVRAIRRF